MENKNVGYIIIGISALMVGIIFLFNNAMKEIIKNGCPIAAEHGGAACPAYGTINQQTYLSLAIVGVIVIIGLVLVFSKQSERVIVKKVPERQKKKEYNLSDLRAEDKRVFYLIKENGTIFQADLIEKTSFGKAKVSRIIDRLEGKGFVERKRRGMTNVVVLKD